MKLVEKEKKEKKKTIAELTDELQEVKYKLEVNTRHLYVGCTQCDETGEPKTKNGVPPKGGTGNRKCKKCGGTGMLDSRLLLLEAELASMRREVSRLSTSLRLHLDKQSVEIRVLPEGNNPNRQGEGGWEGYSGSFDLDSDEEMSIVVEKARDHFETYFKDGFYHRNKRLGVFLTNPKSGKRLIEEMTTEE